MHLQVFKNRGKEYVRIVESFRDPKTKKPKLRVIQTFGNKEKLLAQNPNAIKELQEKVNRMNAEQEQINASALSQRLHKFVDSDVHLPSSEGAPLQNYGYEIYRLLWNELKLDYFFQYRQNRETDIQFQTKTPISLMTFSRLLFPSSKRSRSEEH